MQRIYANYKIITKYRNDTDNPWWGRSPIGRATYIKDWSFSQCERHLTLLAQRVIIRSTLSSFPVMIKSYYSEESLILLQTREFNDIQGIFTLCQTSWIYQMAKMLDIFFSNYLDFTWLTNIWWFWGRVCWDTKWKTMGLAHALICTMTPGSQLRKFLRYLYSFLYLYLYLYSILYLCTLRSLWARVAGTRFGHG